MTKEEAFIREQVIDLITTSQSLKLKLLGYGYIDNDHIEQSVTIGRLEIMFDGKQTRFRVGDFSCIAHTCLYFHIEGVTIQSTKKFIIPDFLKDLVTPYPIKSRTIQL